MKRFRNVVAILTGLVLSTCGPSSQLTPPPDTGAGAGSPVGDLVGGQCLEPDDVNSPWLVGLDATSRGTIARNVERGIVLVKQGECGTFKMLPDCYLGGLYYEDIPARIVRPDAVEISNRRQMQKKVPLAVAKYSAQMSDRELWSLDYVDAGEKSYTGSLPKIDWSKLRSTCREATHYVYKVTRGAFQLSMVSANERATEGNVGPADWEKRSQRRSAERSKDGDYGKCSANEDASDSACRGLIRMWVEPIPRALLAGGGPNSPPSSKGAGESEGNSALDDLLGKGDDTEGPAVPSPESGTKEYKAKLEKKWAVVKKVARKWNTEAKLELYQAFLSEFPVDNPYANIARSKIDKLEAKLTKELEAKRVAEEKAAGIAEKKARSAEIRRAKERAENTTGSSSTKLAAWESFASSYPGSDNPYLKTAKRKIKSLETQIAREESAARLAAKKAEDDAKKKKAASSSGLAGVKWIFSKPAGVKFTKTEITVSQYRACVNAGSCSSKGVTMPYWGGKEQAKYAKYCNYEKGDRGDHPMNCIDWSQAKAVCSWLGGRLPTEDEWYAEASNGGSRKYPWGDREVSCDYAVMKEGGNGCGKDRTWPVCSKKKGNSVSGLCDMSGNLWEWTSDLYDSEHDWRVLRGGSWNSVNPVVLRASYRNWVVPSGRFPNYGVRCARSSH